MMKILALILLISSFSLSIETNFEYKIDNDEHLYKKRIMDKELLLKDFDSIIALKSYLIYNELTSSNIFVNFKLKDNLGVSKTQQFIIRQNNSGTPSIYEIQPGSTIDLNAFITTEVGNDIALKEKYFLPNIFDYNSVDKFLKYTYYHTLKFMIRDDDTVIKRKVNTYGFYITMDSFGVPTIQTSNPTPINNSIQNNTIDALLFSFSGGFNMSKRINFRDTLTIGTEYINKDKLNVNKDLDINMSPSLLSLIKPSDNFLFEFNTYVFDPILLKEVKELVSIQIEEFYMIKAEIEFVD